MGIARNLRRLTRKKEAAVDKIIRRKALMEPLEPRLLLSADLQPEAANAMDLGLFAFEYRLDEFMGGESLLNERVPMVVTMEVDADGNMTYEAPTIKDLFTVPVDANGDGYTGNNPTIDPLNLDKSDDDEFRLDALDTDLEGSPGYGQVDVSEFLNGWFFDPVRSWLDDASSGSYTTEDFTDFLKGDIFDNLDHYLSDLSGLYYIDFDIIDAKVADHTQDPDAQVSFSVGFELSIAQLLPIDLGLEADAIKLQPFTGSPYEAQLPMVPVTSTLSFGFEFGVFTGGQTSEPEQIGFEDFFIRKADMLALNVTAQDTDLDFNLNVGFLGAEVVDGSLDMEAWILTSLRDPDDPNVLGFVDSQSGVEHTSGSITGASLSSPNLSHDAGFFLRIGNVGINTPVTVANNDQTLFDDGNRENSNDLMDDIYAGLESAGVGDVITAAFDGSNRLTLSLPSVYPEGLGFEAEVLGMDTISAAYVSSQVGRMSYDLLDWDVQSFCFLLSVDGQIPKLVTVDAYPATRNYNETPDDYNDDYYVLTIDNLIAQVQAGLNAAGLGDVTAGASSNKITLSASGKSLEISKTLTLDAGVTFNELLINSGEDLFFASKGADSHVDLNLPIRVFPGLEDATTPEDDDWTPENVSIRGKFSPFDDDSPTAQYNETEKRFDLNFTYYPTIDDQDNPVNPSDTNQVPALTAASDEIQLINMAELLNFNLITSENMIGLLMGLGTALQQIADSGLFAGYDIPFADASWADLLNFSDADPIAFSGLIDIGLIYDTKGNGVDAVDDTGKLLMSVVDGEEVYLIPAFVTAQGIDDAGNYGLALALSLALGVPLEEINATYHPIKNELTYDVELIGGERTTITIDDAAFEYDVDLSPFAKMTLYPSTEPSDLVNTLTGYTGLDMTFGINLSPPGTVIYDDTDLVHLNGGAGIDIKTERAVTGEAGVRAVLSSDAWIYIDVDGTGDWITVLASDTHDNKTIQDFAGDINLAIGRSSILDADKVRAGVKDGRLTFTAIGGATTLKVAANSTPKDASGNLIDTSWTELGFAPYFVSGHTVAALKAPTPMVGRLSSDATFWIDIGNDGTDLYEVTVKASATAVNKTMSDLVADVNNALKSAKLGDVIIDLSSFFKADYDISSTQGSRLVLSALNSTTEFWVSGGGPSSQLGLPNSAYANQNDFVIYDSSGNKYSIIMDPTGLDRLSPDYDPMDGLPNDPTVQDVINLINAQIPGDTVVADFNSTHTGLQLYDKLGDDTDATTAQFRAETINGSGALLTLGFFSAGNEGTQNQFEDGNRYLIEGGPIGETHLDDRFFVRDAELWGALKLKTPNTPEPGEAAMETPGAVGSALFGIVGVDTYLSGTMYAEFTAAIKNPNTGVAGGTATLLELFEGAKQGRLTQDASFDVTIQGESPVTVTVFKSATIDDESTPNIDEANDTLANLVADVNQALQAAGLGTQIFARAAGTRIEFVSKVKDNPSTKLDDESIQFTIEAGGLGAAELGLSGTLASEYVEGEQVIAARSASRWAVAEPVVTAASELSYYTGPAPATTVIPFAGGFTTGQVLIGYAAEEVYDGDGVLIGYNLTETGKAKVVENRYNSETLGGVLRLTDVEGAFNTAEWLQAEGTASYAYHSPGEVATRANFGDFILEVHVQDGFNDPGFVAGDGTHGFGLLDGEIYTAPFTITDFGNPYDPAPPVAEFDDLVGDTGDLYAFINLDYADIGSALHELLDLLVDVDKNFGLLNLELPAIGKSISELLGLVDDFERGVSNIDEIFAAALLALDPEAVDLPALTLQDIPNALRGTFGFPEGGDPDVDGVKLDFNIGSSSDPEDGMLLINFNIHESIDTKLGLDITVDENLPNITSSGVLQVNGALDMHLSFGMDLAEPNNAYLFDDTTISAELHVQGEGQTYETSDPLDQDKDGMGLVFRASLGPLAVFIQDGDAKIDVAFSMGMDFGGSDRKRISDVDANRDDDVLTDFDDPVITENYADIVLPMFYGGEGPDNYLGNFEAHGQLVNPATLGKGTLTVEVPDFSGIEADILSGKIEFDPFEYILLAIDTLNLYLENLSDMLASEVLGIQLPFVGDQMADILFIENFRNAIYSTLKNGIANDIDPTPDDVTGLLEGALAAYLVGPVDDSDFDVSSDNIADWYRQWNFTLHDNETIYLTDFDLGIPNLGFDVDIPVKVVLDWTLDIGFGVSFAEGAYIEVSDGNELDIDLTITLPTVGKGMLGFLRTDVTDPGSDTGAVLNFDVNVKNGETANERLGFSDIGKINPDATVWGRSLAEARPVAPVDDSDVVTLHLETKAEWGMPQLMADLIMDWAIPEGTKVNTLNGNAVTPDIEGIGVNYIALNDMEFNAGSVATSLLEPIFGEILGYIEPFMPVIDVLTAPIPVLSDLAGEPFTLLDLAAIFGSVDAEFIDTIADILDVISMIDAAMEQTILELGDLVLYDYSAGITNFDPTDPESKLSEIDLTTLDPASGLTLDTEFNNNEGNDFLEFIRSDPSPVKGLTMPIFTDARQTIGMFLNQNAVMVDYKLPPLAVEFEYLQVFPVFGPLAVSIEISFGFTVDLHSVGFDTYGYQRYAKGGFYNPEVMFDGFYLNDLDAEDVDAPEVLFEFGLVGAAELNLGIARAGVGGGIKAQIFFDWHDPIADGRVHISELIANVETADDNPLAVFDVGGALTFQLFAFLEISIIGFEKEFPITPETELFSFEEEFSHDPILATDIGGGVLMLNMGPTALDRIYGDISDGSESVTVTGSGTNSVTVGGKTFDNISHIIGIGGQGNDSIILNLGDDSIITYELDGGLGDDTITVTGGAGKGVIIGGVGNDILTGGDGNDTIYGGEGNDLIHGGGGQDIIFGDQGRSVQTSAYITTPYITSRVTSADGNDEIYGDDGDDIIIGAGGDDELSGDAGNDILIGDGGRFAYTPTGLDGHIDVASLRPADFVVPEIIPTDGTLPKTPEEISADINGIFDELMETFHSTDLFFGGNDVIHGGENDDMMFGGSGDDMLYGDGGKDLIVAGKGFDEVFGGAGNDTIFGNDQADIISGEGDDDVISGGSGNDYIHGNGGNDVMKGDSGADIIFGDDGDDQLFGLTEPDILFGGIGNDLVVGGTSNDIMFGDDGVVAKLNPDYDPDTDSDSAIGYKVIFNDILITRSEVDSLLASVQNNEGDSWWDDDERSLDLIHTYVKASDGNDILSGEAADDMMFGGGGNDLMGGDVDPRLPNAGGPTDISEDVLIGDGGMITFDQRRFRSISTVKAPVVGTDFDDTIYGDNGNDYIFGGWGSDYLFGGHGKVVDISQGVDGVGAYRGDTDEGAGDADIIFGDNGRIDFAAYSAEHPDNFGILTKAYTTDTVETTGADDYIEGELDNDIIFGGVNNEEVDRLFGHEGRDVVLGDNGMVEFDLDPDMNLATLDRIKSFLDHLGGTDEVSGSQDYDVLIGGTGGDRMYGDDVAASNGSADGKDIMLGDNGWVDLLDAAGPGSVGPGSDLFAFFGGAVVTVRTSDGDPSVDPYAILDDATTGGIDYMYGNYDDDIMAGGAWGDFLYGSVGDDLILGDAARFEWLYDGSEVSVFEKSQNDLLEEFDNTFNTLDLVTTKQPTFGGRDTIDGEADEDTAFGGTDSDLIHGGTEDDILFGDHGRYYPQHSTLAAFASRNFFAIDMGDGDGGDGDRMYGDAGDDSMFGQQGDDRMWGNDGDDDMTGGHNVPGGIDEITTGKIAATLNPPVNDLMDGGAGDDAMAGDNAIIWRRGDELTPDDLSPRFQVLTDDTIYTTTVDTITANINGVWQSDPADADGRDITLIDHSDTIEAMPAGPRLFGADVMAGGADSDTMFGELGNDLMQGDGAIETTPMVQHVVGYPDFISRTLTVDDSGSNPDTDQTLYFNIPEQTSDADDYMEGNGGSDLMYGGLGQDDMIGGSSALFGLTSEQMRPDTTDYIYGGAGIATMRNDIGATSFGLASEDGDTHLITTLANGHSRDADFIMGDNANVYRLVNSSDEFLNFNYDDAYGLQIIPRAMEQLDYTLGGSDYEGGSYTAWGAANADNGAADLIHGESGDDTIFGMTGSDVIFGEGQDDDIVGGYGHDWISGGTGQDGVLGDDGLILTSRNSTLGEPLYGIAGLLAKDPRPKYADGNVLNEVIATPGSIQYAVINLTGELKKTIDLVPFSYDPAWNAMDDEFPDNQDDSPRADDIIFGGLGTDWLHGGSGDDAISGAEALADAYVPVYDAAGTPIAVLDLGYSAVDLPAAAIVPGDPLTVLNPGDVLAFNPTDVLTDHTNNRDRAGEFALYNEYDPRRTILLTPTGVLYTGTEGVNYFQFLLNFEETEGVVRPAGTVPKATGQETESYPAVNDDGKDSIFGDLGNDWLVGGTGRDNLYGGWGNDLLNADDDHDGHLDVNELNDFTDTHPYYEDRAYGGAGRDVLIGNTGGDRLIDWVGEYNSYLVPYAPFGQASVSRTLQPFLPDFLYALSAGDGADPTRENGLDDDPRNGEPDAEMGLVLQKDFAWQDQTGAPADPQAGNIPGGARDVLRSATFNDATNQGFTAASGTWLLKSGVYYVEPTLLGTDAVSVWNHGETLPSYFELTATVTPVKPIAGYKANAFIVFDYYSDEDFKFAGINSSTNKIEIGQRTAAGWQVLTSTNMLVKAGTSYNLLVALNGTTATIRVNNGLTLSYGFAPRVVAGMIYNFNDSGMIGLGADNAKAAIDNVNLMVLPPTITFTCSEDFSTTPALLSSETGDWTISSEGYYVGTPATGESLALAGGSLRIGANYLLQLETKIATEKTGGIIFDQYATDDFKWAGYEKDTNRVMLGHYTDRDGWVVDKSIIIKNLDDGDVTLSLTLKGTTVSVLVNGAAALSHVYNSVLTDGEFGLLAKDGSASFDFFTVKTDDPNVENQQLLTASTAPETPINDGGLLSETDLVPIVKEAIARWENVSGVDGARLAALYDLDFRVVDFTDLTLGKATPDTIYIDADAAGWGWFVDETPEDDVEFVTEGGEDENRMDLLTTVMHEIGHVLGYDDAADDADTLMRATLDAGERYVPDGDSLVVMDGSDLSDGMEEEPDFVPTAKVEDPWLINFLVKKARKDYNPFEPVESIRILVTSDEEDI